ncbi:hypothetical protein [Thermoflavimicrobium dichotomicum]|uniref:Uncharacterized protein n=1 Tax=Thermoflavimicrobium dichotomicum TaxID=46223 RepID=A0A1I3U5P0_9BACL|nr:hypothetical protein [Thermoflavimicrobium dichotomicum]SFJ78888.1 hypothetical protein SAMN05421852_12237 [Thermoflavimicrobium dichotomicum]
MSLIRGILFSSIIFTFLCPLPSLAMSEIRIEVPTVEPAQVETKTRVKPVQTNQEYKSRKEKEVASSESALEKTWYKIWKFITKDLF